MSLTHIDKDGNAIMVDVSNKDKTFREAVACGRIAVGEQCFKNIEDKTVKKGDVLTVAQIAGIMGAKRTSEIIPLCHNISLTKCSVVFKLHSPENEIEAICHAKCHGETGVEMEALTGVSVALLTVYDMCKAINKQMIIKDIHLVSKTGGKSGDLFF